MASESLIHKCIFIGARRVVKDNGNERRPMFQGKVVWFEGLHMWIISVWGTEFDQDSEACG